MSAGPSSAGPSESSSSSAAGKPDRLFVGNLSPTVDEYTLLQVFSKYGKITKLDFMFHKSGVLKGKPRGYAFIEFSNKDDALKAMVKLHDRLLRGRKLVVTYANTAPVTDLPSMTKGRRTHETAKTTTLSLLKSNRRPQSAAAQIAAMEAKLANMAKTKPADEDYVPGQSRLPLDSHSGTASPIPEGYGTGDEEMIGEEEGERAADDLQRELDAELGKDATISTSTESTLPTTHTTSTGGQDEKAVGTAPADPTTKSSIPGLPSRPAVARPGETPTIPAKPPQQRSAGNVPGTSGDRHSQSRSDEFKKGFAGLPRKPAF